MYWCLFSVSFFRKLNDAYYGAQGITLSLGYNSQQPKGLFKRLSGVINLPNHAYVSYQLGFCKHLQQVHVQINWGHEKKKKRVPMKKSHHWPSKKNGSNEAGQPTVFFLIHLRWIDLPTGPRFWSSFGRLGGLEREVCRLVRYDNSIRAFAFWINME